MTVEFYLILYTTVWLLHQYVQDNNPQTVRAVLSQNRSKQCPTLGQNNGRCLELPAYICAYFLWKNATLE